VCLAVVNLVGWFGECGVWCCPSEALAGGFGARVLFENSTVCSKVSASCFGCGSLFLGGLWFFWLSIYCPLCGGGGCSAGLRIFLRFKRPVCCGSLRRGLGVFWDTLMESLILAQDERWRRA
jgi:hypothetical protein